VECQQPDTAYGRTEISVHNSDIMLISETHFTGEKSYLKLPGYTVYHTNHSAESAEGGTAIIIKISIKHHQYVLQATSVSVEVSVGLLTILAVYLPPRYTVKQEQLEDFSQYTRMSVHCTRGLQCKAYRQGFQTHCTKRT
jgi:hypothetical protein